VPDTAEEYLKMLKGEITPADYVAAIKKAVEAQRRVERAQPRVRRAGGQAAA
jgi:hypothetical protein